VLVLSASGARDRNRSCDPITITITITNHEHDGQLPHPAQLDLAQPPQLDPEELPSLEAPPPIAKVENCRWVFLQPHSSQLGTLESPMR